MPASRGAMCSSRRRQLGGRPARPITGLLGLTGIPFTNVFSACATAASTIDQAAAAIRLGRFDIGVAVGADKHREGSFKADPALMGMPQWYGENGQYVTTKFFGMKINRYMHDHDISPTTLAKVAAKNYRNGSLNPKAFRRKPLSVDEILASPMLNHPLTAAMFCAPDEGAARRRSCSAGQTWPPASRMRGVRERNRDPNSQLRRLRGQHDVAALDEDVSPTVYASRRRTRWPGSGQRRSTSSSCRTPTPVPR